MNSGAECSTSRNPLTQFSKHSSEDRSLHHEQFGRGSESSPSMRTNSQQISAQDHQLMSRFMTGDSAHPSSVIQNTFQFDQMNHELNQIHPIPSNNPVANSRWANDFTGKILNPPFSHEGIISQDTPSPGSLENLKWGAEFGTTSSHNESLSGKPIMGLQRFSESGLGYIPRFPTSHLISSTSANTAPDRIIELDNKNWEEQFKIAEETSAHTKEKGKIITQQEMSGTSEGVETTAGEIEKDSSDFENIWENIRSQVLDNVEDWATSDGNTWDRDFDQFARNRPEFGEYEFETNNRYINDPDPFQIGVQLMESGGNLSEAALAFEAAVQQKPHHSEAWGRLGACQAQNEKEDPAIRALEMCITLDPNNLTALMNLAVSYINESYENAAYSTLEKWISMKYPDIVNLARTQEPSLDNEDRYHLHSRVTELFIRAAQLSPDSANIDADVQDGLGVLFYGSEEYDKAIDCFNAAIAARPNDPLLWNRLGATLANSNKSEEAIEAYSRALQLRPSFVRARYNLGVSCINIGCYHEAAQHLLTALSMDHTPEDDPLANQSTNLYATLKRVLSAMDRKDLEAKVGVGMDLNSFRSEFDF